MKNKIKEWWLTWRTGLTTEQRLVRKWYADNINHRASDIEDYFKHFKHILAINPSKVLDIREPFGYVAVDDFKQYTYPSRPLGDNTVYYYTRGEWNPYSGRFQLTDLGSSEVLFAATNNGEDATMIALKYS